MGQYNNSLDFDINAVVGGAKGAEDGVKELKERVKFLEGSSQRVAVKLEISKTNGIMDQVTERVKQLGESKSSMRIQGPTHARPEVTGTNKCC